MNDVYFACKDCRVMLDAGYRWAYWELEQTGAVHRGQPVSAAAVTAASSYWVPPEEPSSKWLQAEVLPSVRSFLETHGGHRITYGEYEEVLGTENFHDWMQIGYDADPTPRYFVEVVGLRTWKQVLDWLAALKVKPVWCDDPESVDYARMKFDELVKR